MVSHTLVAVDDSEPARRALEFAVGEFSSSTITALHVVEGTNIDTYQTMTGGHSADADTAQQTKEHDAEALFDDLLASLPEQGSEVATEVVSGDPSTAIVSYAEANDVDHIVIGSRGESGAKRLVVGNVAEDVIRESDSPVTVVK